MTTRHWLLIASAGVAGLVSRPSTGNAQDWAQIRTGAAATVYFKVAVPLASFREMTFLRGSLGHAPTAFMDTMMVRHIMAGVQFALGDLDADTTPGNQPAGK